jgi:hypothetical protein
MQMVLPHREALVRALHSRFGSRVELAEIEAEVELELSSFADARVTDFLPILVERKVQARLDQRCSR